MNLSRIITVRNIFLAISAIAFYLSYIKPKIKGINKIKNDNSLKIHLTALEQFSDTDKHSYMKGQQHLKRFFLYYNKSFESNTADKLKQHAMSSMKYFRRIALRVVNDLESEQRLTQTIDNINNLLEQYIYEASDRHLLNYNGSYM